MAVLAQVRELEAIRDSFFLSPFTIWKLYLQDKITCHYFHYYYTNQTFQLWTALVPKGFLAPPLPLWLLNLFLLSLLKCQFINEAFQRQYIFETANPNLPVFPISFPDLFLSSSLSLLSTYYTV